MDAKGANCTTIFLADDDATVRQTLNDFFARCPNYQVVGTASNGMDAVERCKQLRPDVDQAKLMLMEIRGMSEDEAYQYIRELSRRKGMSMMKVAQYIIAKLESSQ